MRLLLAPNDSIALGEDMVLLPVLLTGDDTFPNGDGSALDVGVIGNDEILGMWNGLSEELLFVSEDR